MTNYLANKEELNARRERLVQRLNVNAAGWDTALIVNKLSVYYLTGSMQDGLLILRKDGALQYYVRKSFARAQAESPLEDIFMMRSYKDIPLDANLGNTLLETETVPYAMLQRLQKVFTMQRVDALEPHIMAVRAVKSAFELEVMREAGKRQAAVLNQEVHKLLREGMSEADFHAELFLAMQRYGYMGSTRFGMFQCEVIGGQLGFGENCAYPSSFNGPGGMRGDNPAVPFFGDMQRKLKRGDLVFVDTGFGFMGYHTDRTQVYFFGEELPKEAERKHAACLQIQREIARRLVPGGIPSQIYADIMNDLPEGIELDCFMGPAGETVRFLGHGTGLQVDEHPVIARGFDAPLEAGMTIAVEPKYTVAGLGIVGLEDTYLVAEGGGECLTGGECGIIVVK